MSEVIHYTGEWDFPTKYYSDDPEGRCLQIIKSEWEKGSESKPNWVFPVHMLTKGNEALSEVTILKITTFWLAAFSAYTMKWV